VRRLNKPKRQEHQAYYYSLTGMTLFAVIEIITGSGNTLDTDYYTVDKDSTTDTVVLFMVPRTPIGSTAVEGVVTGTSSGAGTGDTTEVAANSQADSAVLVLEGAAVETWTDVASFALHASDYGTAGDIVELIGVPNPLVDGNWTGIDYIRSLDITPGQMIEPVPSDMEPQLVTRRIRQEHAFDISGEYVDNNTGLAAIRGREVSIMVEHHEDGGPVVSEYVILGNAAVQDAPPSAPDNAPITISAAGSYRRRLIYAP
jgi:hypothetical protein